MRLSIPLYSPLQPHPRTVVHSPISLLYPLVYTTHNGNVDIRSCILSYFCSIYIDNSRISAYLVYIIMHMCTSPCLFSSAVLRNSITFVSLHPVSPSVLVLSWPPIPSTRILHYKILSLLTFPFLPRVSPGGCPGSWDSGSRVCERTTGNTEAEQ